MTTTEQKQAGVERGGLMDGYTYNRYVTNNPGKEDMLSFSEWAEREQVRLLRGINSKLNFFVLLIILGIILSFIQGITR